MSTKKCGVWLLGLFLFANLFVGAAVVEGSIIAPNEANYGEIITINIVVKNLGSKEKTLTVETTVEPSYLIEPKEMLITSPPNLPSWQPPYLKWEITIPSNAEKTVSYKVKPSVGTYSIAPTIYYDGETFSPEFKDITISCSAGTCNLDIGETYELCGAKCSGVEDNYCDGVIDNKCDPDCTHETDEDCIKPEIWVEPWLWIVIVALVLAIILIYIFFLRRRSAVK